MGFFDFFKSVSPAEPVNAINPLESAREAEPEESIIMEDYCELGKKYARIKQYNKAVDTLKKGIAVGDPECAYILGNLYEGGYLGENRNGTALLYYEKGVAMNHARSAYKAAKLLYFGNGVNENHALAVTYLKIGLEQNNSDCQCLMGTMYELGCHVFMADYKMALKYYKAAAEQGEQIACFAIGKFYMDGLGGLVKDENKAVQIFKKLAEEDYPGAAIRVALYYCQERDNRESLKWALKGCEIDDANCQMLAGCIYEDGTAGYKDPDKAMEYYKKAANNGEAKAYINMGFLNYDHYQRYFSALEDFRHAADAGVDGALNYLNQVRSLLVEADYGSREIRNQMIEQVNRVDPRDRYGNLI